MPSTPTEVTRTDDSTGDTFEVYENDAGRVVQSAALSPEVQGELLSWAQTGSSAENEREVKASPGRLFRVSAILDPGVGSDRYLMVFDAIGALSGGETPVLRALVPAGGEGEIDLGLYGREFSVGIVVAVSTTIATFTAPGSAEAFFQAGYH